MTLTSFFGWVNPKTMNLNWNAAVCVFFPPCFLFGNVFLLTVFAWSGLPLSFLCAERWIRRVLDQSAGERRRLLAWFLLVCLGFFKRMCMAASPLSAGSWVVSNLAKNGRPSSAPKPRNSPTSTSRTSGTTWMTSGWRNSSINTVKRSDAVAAADALLFAYVLLLDVCRLQGRRSVWRSWWTQLANPEASDSLVMRSTRMLTRYFLLLEVCILKFPGKQDSPSVIRP